MVWKGCWYVLLFKGQINLTSSDTLFTFESKGNMAKSHMQLSGLQQSDKNWFWFWFFLMVSFDLAFLNVHWSDTLDKLHSIMWPPLVALKVIAAQIDFLILFRCLLMRTLMLPRIYVKSLFAFVKIKGITEKLCWHTLYPGPSMKTVWSSLKPR